MCSACIGNPKTQTLHACFQGLVNCKNGSFEILDGETLFMMSMIVYDEKLCFNGHPRHTSTNIYKHTLFCIFLIFQFFLLFLWKKK